MDHCRGALVTAWTPETMGRKGGQTVTPAKAAANAARSRRYWAEVRAGRPHKGRGLARRKIFVGAKGAE